MRIDWIDLLVFPQIAQHFRSQKADNDDHHHRLAEQAETSVMHLHRVHIVLSCSWCAAHAGRNGRAADTIHGELASNLKEHLDTVDEEEHDDDQQQRRIAAVKDVRVRLAIGDQMRREHFGAEQAVRQQVERHEAEERLGQEVRGAHVAQMENL